MESKGTKGQWLFENPVDYFNRNHPDEGLALLLKDKAIVPLGLGKYGQVGRPPTEVAMEYKDGYLHVNEHNTLGFEKGKVYSPFEILRKLMHKNSFQAAFKYVGHKYMDMQNEYLRVGIKYFKEVEYCDRSGIPRKKLIPWAKDEIKEDLGKEGLAYVDQYDTFVMEPNNIKYEAVIEGNYNMYAPFTHRRIECSAPEQIKWSLKLVRHIFGEQYELGMRYLRVLYEFPQQALPILVLVSEDRSTGKSTFVDWLNVIFGDNMVIINPQDMSSSFNESYGLKNIIAIEESRFDSVQTTEKLKALATMKNLNINAKYQNPYQVPFYGKLIITSNDESKFSKVDEKEIRYWTRKIPSITESNHQILQDLTDEIPYFLDYLMTKVPEIDFSKSRQVFTLEEIETDALRTVKKESRSGLHKELDMLFDDWMANNQEVEVLQFVAKDLKEFWFSHNNQFSAHYISHVLSVEMRLERTEKMKRYTPFYSDDITGGFKKEKKGHYFEVKNKYFGNLDSSNEQLKFNENEKNHDYPF